MTPTGHKPSPEPDPLREAVSTLIGGTRREGILAFHDDNLDLIRSALGSSHNHQAWVGGYYEHIRQCFMLAQDLYASLSRYKHLPFDLENALVVLYLHDIEKIFKYGEGTKPLYVKQMIQNKEVWYFGILPEKYKIYVQNIEINALQYVHGEGDHYSGTERVMNPLAAFCHAVDVMSARIFFDVRDLTGMKLWKTCVDAVGKRVKYTGTNGDEYDKENHGKPIEGEGLCYEQHDSHGLCIMVRHDDGTEVCVDPIEVIPC